jgi:hypothetical protein
MNIKDLALVIWAGARTKIPSSSKLPVILKIKADSLIKDCINNQFLFDWGT